MCLQESAAWGSLGAGQSAGRPLLSPWAVSAQATRDSGVPIWAQDKEGQGELHPAETVLSHSLTATNTVLGEELNTCALPAPPIFRASHMQSAGCETERDRHTDTKCLPSMAIVERKVRKGYRNYQREGEKKNRINKGSRQNLRKKKSRTHRQDWA